MPSNSFYVVLPSNTNVLGNRTNTFRVRLPRKLQFNSEWEVGLAVIVYPYSWPSLGTMQDQFVLVEWKTGQTVRIPIPASNLTNPSELRTFLNNLLVESSKEMVKQLKSAQQKYTEAVAEAEKKALEEFIMTMGISGWEIPGRDPTDTDESWLKKQRDYVAEQTSDWKKLYNQMYKKHKEAETSKIIKHDVEIYNSIHAHGGIEAWFLKYHQMRTMSSLEFDPSQNRFTFLMDKWFVKSVTLSEQLSYILGFNTTELAEPVNIAKFMPDMSGGVSSFNVYAPDLIEPMMIGDVTAPVLRIVTVRGKPDEIVEDQFLSIQYHKLLLKEIAEIFIEIRTSTGSLMPFQYGTCTLTLHFRKASYF